MPRVFISHSSMDRTFVEREIITLLENHGIETWYSSEHVETASDWHDKIVEGLKNCDWFIVVISPNAIKSDWVKSEVHWALEERKERVVPIFYQSCDINTLHLKLRRIQYIDFRRDLKAARIRLLAVWKVSYKPEAEDFSEQEKTSIEQLIPSEKKVINDPLIAPDSKNIDALWGELMDFTINFIKTADRLATAAVGALVANVQNSLSHHKAEPSLPLPVPEKPLIGREKELAEVRDLLLNKNVGILTLTGTFGTGKTRLCLEVANELKDSFAGGVFYIELASVSNPDHVISIIARIFGIVSNQQLVEAIKTHLSNKQLLLILDNFEQVLEAAPSVQELIESCPELKVLVTSRVPLKIRDERTYPVSTLKLPPEDIKKLSLEELSYYSAVELFIERAQTVYQEFTLNRENSAAIIEICRRLDGLPLAIELAAAHIKLFTPQTLLKEMVDSSGRLNFSFLRNVNLDPHQRTLWETIAWSYNLLDEPEKRVFRQLAVFVGGCSFEAAKVVCKVKDVFESVTLLVNKSLLVPEQDWDGKPRFRMLETIREFGLKVLMEKENKKEKKQTERQHAIYFLQMAEEKESRLSGADPKPLMNWFKEEQDNLRAALSWALENDPEIALRLAYRLSGFWNVLGHLNEEREALKQALEKGKKAPIKWQMHVLGRAANRQSNPESAKELAEEHLKLSRIAKKRLEKAWALHNLGVTERILGNLEEGSRLLEEALPLFRQEKDTGGLSMALLNLCVLAVDQNDLPSAHEFVTECLALSRKTKNRGDEAVALTYLAFVHHKKGEQEKSHSLLDESEKILRLDGRKSWLPWGLHWRGRIAIYEKNYESALDHLKESLEIFRENEDKGGMIRSLSAFSYLSAVQGDWERTVRLLGAEEAQRELEGSPFPPDWKEEIDYIITEGRRALGESKFTTIWSEGEKMTLDEVVNYALRESDN